MKLMIIFLLTTLLTACVTISDPVSLGDDRYMLHLNARGGFSSDGELLEETIKQANAFCASQNKKAVILNTETSGTQMWTPQNNKVVFKCIEQP